MSDVLLFHHVQGLTEGVEAFGDELRRAGHQVTLPDLYDGATFDSIDAGVSHAEVIGFAALLEEGVRIADPLPRELVYAGFSLGALVAHKLAQTRPGARGALLYHHGDVPIDAFGDTWPEGVDVQIHVAEGDEFYQPDVAKNFVDRAGENARAELFVYPGSSHLFADSGLPGYDADATALVVRRSVEFLERVA